MSEVWVLFSLIEINAAKSMLKSIEHDYIPCTLFPIFFPSVYLEYFSIQFQFVFFWRPISIAAVIITQQVQ